MCVKKYIVPGTWSSQTVNNSEFRNHLDNKKYTRQLSQRKWVLSNRETTPPMQNGLRISNPTRRHGHCLPLRILHPRRQRCRSKSKDSRDCGRGLLRIPVSCGM